MDADAYLKLVNVVVLAVVGALTELTRRGTKAAEKALEKAAVTQAEIVVRNRNWPTELAQALENTRGVQRQELRYRSYGALWSVLRPLSLYHNRGVNKRDVADLSASLTDWYFSPDGGLLLTRQTRSFYFALQELLEKIGSTPWEWDAARREDVKDEKEVFEEVLLRLQLTDTATVFKELMGTDPEDPRAWPEKSPALGTIWHDGVRMLAERWKDVADGERFVVIQQVGSVLRTTLTNDLESRLR